jgi:hypothetical protein
MQKDGILMAACSGGGGTAAEGGRCRGTAAPWAGARGAGAQVCMRHRQEREQDGDGAVQAAERRANAGRCRKGRRGGRQEGCSSVAVGDARKGDDAPGGRRQHLFVDVQEEGEQEREGNLGPATCGAGMRCRGEGYARIYRARRSRRRGEKLGPATGETDGARHI